MRFTAARFTVAALLTSALAACAPNGSSVAPAGPAANIIAPPAVREPVPNVAGIYNGTVTETSQGRSIKAPLKITIRQQGAKFTGIFDMILKTVSDEFPIIKGVVSTASGKTFLHFVIEGSPHRNARATATVANGLLKGKAKVSAKHGPAVHFTYSAKKQ